MDYIYIGRVAGTHGVRGGVKVFPTTDEPDRFIKLKRIILEDTQGNDTEYTIKGVKFSSKFVVLQLEGIDDMDQAMALKQAIVKLPRSEALPLEEDEFYIQDLMGLTIYEENRRIGVLKDVLFTGSNEVYVIELLNGKELLLPAIKECVLKVDLENMRMDVHVMEGLL